MNFETMKYFNADRHEEKRYYDTAKELANAEVKAQCVYNFTSLGQYVIAYIGILIIIFMAGRDVVIGHIEVADFVMIYEYLKNLYQPLEQLGKLYLDLKQQILDSEGMFFLLNEPAEIQDKPSAPQFQIAPDEQAEIEFRNVSFNYQKNSNDAKVQVINDLSFKIKSGERVAIVGPSGKFRMNNISDKFYFISGVGKSTLTRLLYRMYDVNQGAILINGVNIADVQQDSLRQYIGVVPQDVRICILHRESIVL